MGIACGVKNKEERINKKEYPCKSAEAIPASRKARSLRETIQCLVMFAAEKSL